MRSIDFWNGIVKSAVGVLSYQLLHESCCRQRQAVLRLPAISQGNALAEIKSPQIPGAPKHMSEAEAARKGSIHVFCDSRTSSGIMRSLQDGMHCLW